MNQVLKTATGLAAFVGILLASGDALAVRTGESAARAGYPTRTIQVAGPMTGYQCFNDNLGGPNGGNGAIAFYPATCPETSGGANWNMPIPTEVPSPAAVHLMAASTNVYATTPIGYIGLRTYTNDGLFYTHNYILNSYTGTVGPMYANVPAYGYAIITAGLHSASQGIMSYAWQYDW